MIAREHARLLTPAFLAISLASLAYFIADGITIPVLQKFVVGPLGGDNVAVGIAYGAFSITALVLRPLVGSFSDRRGRRPVIVGGAGLFVLGMLGHLLATSLPILLFMRLVLGAAEALIFVGLLAAASDLAPEGRRGEAISYFSLSLYVGVALGPFIGELVLREDRFAAVWIVAAAMAAAAAVFGLRAPETLQRGMEAESSVQPISRHGWRSVIHPGGVLPGLVLLTGAIGMGGFFAFMRLYSESLGMDGSRWAFATLAAIVIVFRSVMPWMPDRLGPRRGAAIALAFNAAGMGIIGLWAAPIGLYLGTAVFAFGVCFAFPALSTLTAESVPPAERGSALGTFSSFLDLGFGLGPVLLGLVAEAAGFRGVWLVSSVVAVAGLGLLWVTRAPVLDEDELQKLSVDAVP
jgi:MFS family permease